MKYLLFFLSFIVIVTSKNIKSSRKDDNYYYIKLQVNGYIRDEFVTELLAAKDVVESMITTHFPNKIQIPFKRCGCYGVDWTCLPTITTFRDLLVYVRIAQIDGVGNVGGRAGVCRIGRGYSRIGLIELDESDAIQLYNQKILKALFIHELLHTVGVGSLWSTYRLVNGTEYKGKYGNSVYGKAVVENVGGIGSTGSHWSENAHGNEIMTSRLDYFSNPISNLTLQSLRDIGHRINPSFVPDSVMDKMERLSNRKMNINHTVIIPKNINNNWIL
jgi:hypothetical protein